MNKYYIYLHRRMTDNQVFYVGKGTGLRAWNFNNRNKYWTNVKNKHGVTVEVIFNDLFEQESLSMEKDIILGFNQFGCKLVNLTTGGESPVFSEESLRKMSISGTGRKHSKESVEKRASTHRGKKRSEETCRNISNSLKGKKIPEERARRSALNRTGDKSVNSDKNVYSFSHENGETFTDTRFQLCKQYLLKSKNINKLFYSKPRKTSQCWSLLKEQNDN